MGFIAGGGLALYDLSEYSRVSTVVSLLLPVLAGGLLGALMSQFSWALGTLLLVIVVSVAVSALALAYPEFQVKRLGLDLTLEISIAKSLSNVVVLGVPLAIVGLLLGRFFARNE